MCLALPGKLLDRREAAEGLPFGRVAFGSAVRDTCLVYVPEAKPGEYLIVHAGFALQRLDTAAAERVLEAWQQREPQP